MAKSKKNNYLAITDEKIVHAKSIDEARALTHKKDGGNVMGFDSYQEANDAIPAIRKAIKARLAKKKPKRNKYSGNRPKDNLAHLLGFLDSEPASSIPKPKHVSLACSLGSGGNVPMVSNSDGSEHEVAMTSGAKAPRKRLELGYAALKLADDALKQGADTVEILGLDVTVVNTLTVWADGFKLRDWKASNGNPLANIEIVKPMVALYDDIQAKVSLGKREESESLPF
ncbi:hypothetical protein A9259_20075 [Vibrio cyclitrophicus]|uniref:hypothetical protein n=1 Tax=Vibrio cyclitrophicus TaxID=47951 RepID=UPI0007EEEF3A|nr:hypothetical protein [Vibrio cyclitrophicus]OBT01607.1 hypothetical protein A9259_20075 [Vibrio cyclitrophicus]